MGIKKTLYALVTIATIGLAGCSEKSVEEIQKDITIFGKPISVVYTPNTYSEYGGFTGVFEVNGKPLLAYKQWKSNKEGFPNAKAAALIQSEMNDGDDELVNLTGQYRGDQFELSSIEANGYKINFY